MLIYAYFTFNMIINTVANARLMLTRVGVRADWPVNIAMTRYTGPRQEDADDLDP